MRQVMARPLIIRVRRIEFCDEALPGPRQAAAGAHPLVQDQDAAKLDAQQFDLSPRSTRA